MANPVLIVGIVKLRITSDTLRLRLSGDEAQAVARAGRLEESVNIAGRRLTYALEARGEHVTASFDGERVTISVPPGALRQWSTSDELGLSAVHGSLRILVEKDLGRGHPG